MSHRSAARYVRQVTLALCGFSLLAASSVSWTQAIPPNSQQGQGRRGRRPGFIPPPPGVNTAQPTQGANANTNANNARGFVPAGIDLVAGVRLDQPATMPAALNDVRAVAYDPLTRQITLIGSHRSALPAFHLEDLAVALKADGDGFPAVSIEGPMRDEQMTVHYYGGIEGTRFGKTLFEADRLLKSLALGRDNLTKEYLRPRVASYESEVKKLRRMGGAQRPQAWHRYWFRPALVSMTASEDGRAVRFDEVKIEVKTEYVPAVAEGDSEPAAEEFAQQFTDHYDEYAAQYPVFAELKELAKVTALAQWLKQNNVALDALHLDKAVIPAVATPETTPIGYAQALTLLPEGLFKHQMEGGVSLRLWQSAPVANDTGAPAGNWIVNRAGAAPDLLRSVMRKPGPEAARWLNGFAAALPSDTPVEASAPAP